MPKGQTRARSKPRDPRLVERGARIIEARERCGMTQTELADELGIRVHVLWRYETGRADASAQRLDEIACAIGVSSHWILTGDEAGEQSPPEHPALAEFLSSPIGETVTEAERQALRRLRLPGRPSDRAYYLLLMALREMS